MIRRTILKRKSNHKQENTFTAFIFLSVMHLLMDKYAMHMSTLMMEEVLNSFLTSTQVIFSVETLLILKKTMITSWTDLCKNQILKMLQYKLCWVQCSMEKKPFTESLIPSYYSDLSRSIFILIPIINA